MTHAPMVNRYRNPRAFFATRQEAHEAACAINDRFEVMSAFYRRIDDRMWQVEAPGIALPAFLKALAAAGCVGRCF